MEQLGLIGAKGVSTPGDVVRGKPGVDSTQGSLVSRGPRAEGSGNADKVGGDLSKEEETLFRSVAAQANYLAQDRPDIAYATQEVCRHMASPTAGAMKALKRLARYLIAKPRLKQISEKRANMLQIAHQHMRTNRASNKCSSSHYCTKTGTALAIRQ